MCPRYGCQHSIKVLELEQLIRESADHSNNVTKFTKGKAAEPRCESDETNNTQERGGIYMEPEPER